MKINFKGKKTAVIGLSTEGLELIKFLVNNKALVTACDQKYLKILSPEIQKTLKNHKVDLSLGNNYLHKIDDFEIIFRSPGMPLWHPKLEKARKKGKIIHSLTKLFFDLCPCPIIGITGTKGKGTTSALIGNILKQEGKRVFVGGNIGNPLINKIPEITKESWVVFELSSFQLEDLDKSPHIAVVLNITPDHLNSSSLASPNYHQSMNEYYQAKKNIVSHQNKNDYAVINLDYQSSRNFTQFTPADILYFSCKKEVKKGAFVKKHTIYLNSNHNTKSICQIKDVLLKGKHNLENITASIAAASLTGVKISSISQAIKKFKGLEHRLEFVKIIRGVEYYNDSFSTNPETTIAAINSFSSPVILIAGGSEKGAVYQEMGNKIAENNIKCVILIGEMAKRMEDAIIKNNFQGKIIQGLKNMRQIVSVASNEAVGGDIVLLSPGAASFDMFENYKDRGNQFKNEVQKLEEKRN